MIPTINLRLGNNRAIPMLALALLVSAVLACSGCGGASKAQKRAYRADEAVSKQRLRLVEEYERCLGEAGDDWNAEQACERFLKSAEALK